MRPDLTLRCRSLGFSLVELAIALLVLALALGGVLLALDAQVSARNYGDSKKNMEDAREALYGFAVANNRLPCPDTSVAPGVLDGLEDTTNVDFTNTPAAGQNTRTFTCVATEGWLPYATLGIGGADSWGRRLRYRVATPLAERNQIWQGAIGSGTLVTTTTNITVGSTGNSSVFLRGDNPLTTGTVESKYPISAAGNVPAIIISHGKNGYGAIDMQGIAQPAVPASNLDETANANAASTTKWSRPISAVDSGCSETVEGSPPCEFDDVVVWIPMNVLIAKMANAGRF